MSARDLFPLPRIRRQRYVMTSFGMVEGDGYECNGRGERGAGRTPAAAYDSWLTLVAHFQASSDHITASEARYLRQRNRLWMAGLMVKRARAVAAAMVL